MNMEEMTNIKQDIQANLKNIIQNIELKPFMKILEKYYEKIGKFETELETIDFQDGNQWEIVSKTRGEHGYFD